MTDKYDIGFPASVVQSDVRRLVNQIWKLLPMRENNEDWITHKKTVTEEICGLVEIYKNNPSGLSLLSQLEGLTSKECDDFMIFRKVIFSCIDLLPKVVQDEES